MNKKYLYLISGLLLCICVLIAYQVTQAAISNPGHGTSALEGNASLNMNSNKIINLSTPSAGTDAATKAYVDGRPIGTLSCNIVVGTVAGSGTVNCASGYLATGCATNVADIYYTCYPSGTSCYGSDRRYCYAICCKIQ